MVGGEQEKSATMPDSVAAEAVRVDPDTAEPVVRPVPQPVSPGLRRFLALEDFETAARRRLPRMIYGFVAGAVETGAARANARAGYGDYALIPRTLMDVAGRQHDCELFGRRYAAPFGVAPLGGAAMAAYRGDIVLAEAAQSEGVPMILSAASLIKLEEVRRSRPNTWMQLYLAGDQARIDAMIDRVGAAGFDTLVVTVDTPVPGNRENNVRNGFSLPLSITPRTALDSALHPQWLFGVIARTFRTHGAPHFENMDAEHGPPLLSRTAMRNMRDRDGLAWPHIEAIRRRWSGTLIIKGLLSAADARQASALGCDGIVVSSHGGRQLDHAIAPIRALPEMVAAAGDMTVMIDGGIRRGTDVLKALALGAKFVFLGRPFLYAAVVGGAPAVMHAMRLLSSEIDRNMALMGLRNLSELGPDAVRALPCIGVEP